MGPQIAQMGPRIAQMNLKGRQRALRFLFIVGLSLLISPLLWAENVLLISVDTLRADRLSAYGYRKNQTPNIDRWAAEGLLFDQAFSEGP